VALPVFLLLFPQGTLRSSRYRVPFGAAIAGAAIALIGIAGSIERWSGSRPLEAPAWLAHIPAIKGFPAFGFLVSCTAAFGGVLSLVLRYRSSTGEERQPLRLLVGMVGAMAVVTALA